MYMISLPPSPALCKFLPPPSFHICVRGMFLALPPSARPPAKRRIFAAGRRGGRMISETAQQTFPSSFSLLPFSLLIPTPIAPKANELIIQRASRGRKERGEESSLPCCRRKPGSASAVLMTLVFARSKPSLLFLDEW